jgi:HEAT repeat protein
VAALACLALGDQADAKTIPQLTTMVRNDDGADLTRAACATALAGFPEPPVGEALLYAFEHGGAETRRAAALALGRVRAPETARAALVRAVFLAPNRIREAAVSTLCARPGAGGNATRAVEWDPSRPERDLAAAIASRLPTLATRCDAAGDMSLQAIPAITDALARHRDLALRTLEDLDSNRDAIALGPLGAPAGLAEAMAGLAEPLSQLARHTDPLVREHALRALAKLGAASAEGAIVAALRPPRPTCGRPQRAQPRFTSVTRGHAPTRSRARSRRVLQPGVGPSAPPPFAPWLPIHGSRALRCPRWRRSCVTTRASCARPLPGRWPRAATRARDHSWARCCRIPRRRSAPPPSRRCRTCHRPFDFARSLFTLEPT